MGSRGLIKLERETMVWKKGIETWMHRCSGLASVFFDNRSENIIQEREMRANRRCWCCYLLGYCDGRTARGLFFDDDDD